MMLRRPRIFCSSHNVIILGQGVLNRQARLGEMRTCVCVYGFMYNLH